jgi:hypothetical protein
MDVKSRYLQARALKTVEALKKNGFNAVYAPTKQEAISIALNLVPQNATVGVGGSVTIRELGIVESLKMKGHLIFDHYQGTTDEEKTAACKAQLTSDVFFASSNAVSIDGKLVNIDGTGNRVASMIYGPGQVILVIGAHKITDNLQQAIERAKQIAAPLNAERLNRNTPCVASGVCHNCDSKERICKVTTIIEKKPSNTPFTVIIVGEEIGY